LLILLSIKVKLYLNFQKPYSSFRKAKKLFMLAFILSLVLFPIIVLAGSKPASTPPIPNLPKDYTKIQQNTACRVVDGNWKFTAIAYNPQYDDEQQLKSYSGETEVVVDENFQDSASNRTKTLPKGWLAHDSITKVQCTDSYYVEQPTNVDTTSIDYTTQGFFYARCSNGYMKTCHTDGSHQDNSLTQYYQKYTVNATYKKCLTAKRDELLHCRKLCDVTHIHQNTNYQLSVTPTEFQDFIGFNNETAEEEYATYYYLKPQNNISVNCVNNTFLAHSTGDDDKFTTFSVTCNKDGYVATPEGDGESACVDTYACNIPSDSSSVQWGLYKEGKWTSVNKVQHGAYVYVKCGSEEKFVTCMNGNLFPTEQYACIDE
jgi:hypothetical protein